MEFLSFVSHYSSLNLAFIHYNDASSSETRMLFKIVNLSHHENSQDYFSCHFVDFIILGSLYFQRKKMYILIYQITHSGVRSTDAMVSCRRMKAKNAF